MTTAALLLEDDTEQPAVGIPLDRQVRALAVEATRWVCVHPDGEVDHDWTFKSDWYGDPGVIGGTADCSVWVCRACGAEDPDREPPHYDDCDDY